MAIAVHPSRRYVTHRPPWVRQRAAESNAALPLIVVVMLAVGITGLLLSSQMLDVSLPRSLARSGGQAASHRPTDGAKPASAISPSAPAEQARIARGGQEAASPPAAEARWGLATGARARVANTDNLGVVLYAAPRDDARQPAGLLEGTSVTVLDLSGDAWARVQSDSKQSGWVRAAYLVPAE